ncbi:MAG: spore coat protein CotJB [Clostridia bacterium]|nr:spore coat protein CotJB [Clostridia bacterium]
MLEDNMENRHCNSCECSCEGNNEMSCACKNDLREEMMMQLRAYKFSIIELALYLDTHPDDEKALCLHREYAKKAKELADKYQKMFGPLTIDYPCKKWRWLEEPWPWERGNF